MKKLLAAIFTGLFALAVTAPAIAQDKKGGKKMENKAEKTNKKAEQTEKKAETSEKKADDKKTEKKAAFGRDTGKKKSEQRTLDDKHKKGGKKKG